MRIIDWSSDVCSSDLCRRKSLPAPHDRGPGGSAWVLRFRSLDFREQKAFGHGSTRMTRTEKQNDGTHRVAHLCFIYCFLRAHPCNSVAKKSTSANVRSREELRDLDGGCFRCVRTVH